MVMYDQTNSSFIRSRKLGKPYVDKTGFIKALLARNMTVCLFTRPRRFGKSMNLTTLDAFLNLKYVSESEEWFKGLEIDGAEECKIHRNAYPVVRMNFGNVSGYSRTKVLNSLSVLVSNVYNSFPELEESPNLSPHDRSLFHSVLYREADEETLMDSGRMLCEMLHRHYGIAPVVLIDEYDKPITDTYDRQENDDILVLLRDFFRPIIKDNEDLRLCVITGVSQISKESMFSGLNNLYVNNILSTDMGEWFGFTESEVEAILSDDRGVTDMERMRVAREWYDGYRMGDSDVYNPWSILLYNNTGMPQCHWVNTGKDTVIRDYLRRSAEDFHEDLQKLVDGEGLLMDVSTTVTLRDLESGDERNLFSMMLTAGYLTAEKTPEGVMLRVPNMEMGRHLWTMVHDVDSRGDAVRMMDSLAHSIMGGDADAAVIHLADVMRHFFPYGKARYEEGYKTALFACMSFLGRRFQVRGEESAGDGRADILIRRLHGCGYNVVMELKRVGDSDDPAVLAESAIRQIVEKRYTYGMSGPTLLYGIAVGGAEPVLRMEEVDLP